MKIHVAVVIKKKKIVALDVTSEEVYDGSRLKELVDNALESNTLKRIIAEGGYDSNENFQHLSNKKIGAAIKVRKNSSYYGSGPNFANIVLQQVIIFYAFLIFKIVATNSTNHINHIILIILNEENEIGQPKNRPFRRHRTGPVTKRADLISFSFCKEFNFCSKRDLVCSSHPLFLL